MIKCNVEGLDKAIRDGHKNIQRFGGLFLDMYASNVARGMCLTRLCLWGKPEIQGGPGESPGKVLPAVTLRGLWALLGRLTGCSRNVIQ